MLRVPDNYDSKCRLFIRHHGRCPFNPTASPKCSSGGIQRARRAESTSRPPSFRVPFLGGKINLSLVFSTRRSFRHPIEPELPTEGGITGQHKDDWTHSGRCCAIEERVFHLGRRQCWWSLRCASKDCGRQIEMNDEIHWCGWFVVLWFIMFYASWYGANSDLK